MQFAQTLQGFPGHKDIVSGLAFRAGTHELFSASFDRTVKIWSLDDRAYVDTLFGHQAEVLAIDLLRQVGFLFGVSVLLACRAAWQVQRGVACTHLQQKKRAFIRWARQGGTTCTKASAVPVSGLQGRVACMHGCCSLQCAFWGS
jgi:hypothetical protein